MKNRAFFKILNFESQVAQAIGTVAQGFQLSEHIVFESALGLLRFQASDQQLSLGQLTLQRSPFALHLLQLASRIAGGLFAGLSLSQLSLDFLHLVAQRIDNSTVSSRNWSTRSGRGASWRGNGIGLAKVSEPQPQHLHQRGVALALLALAAGDFLEKADHFLADRQLLVGIQWLLRFRLASIVVSGRRAAQRRHSRQVRLCWRGQQ